MMQGSSGYVQMYHGTDAASAAALAAGSALDLAAATAHHTDGEVGFYLASEPEDAEFFAVRLGTGRVISYVFASEAWAALLAFGAVHQPIPLGPASPYFQGAELFVPAKAFSLFNKLLKRGEISVGSTA